LKTGDGLRKSKCPFHVANNCLGYELGNPYTFNCLGYGLGNAHVLTCHL